jgi:hypothetical protein
VTLFHLTPNDMNNAMEPSFYKKLAILNNI